MRIKFMEWEKFDLVTGAVYEGGIKGNISDEVIGKLMDCGNAGGFRIKGSTNPLDLKYVILSSTLTEQRWMNSIDEKTNILTYYGDNKKPGTEITDTHNKGNLILETSYELLKNKQRKQIPPFFIFTKEKGRNVIFKGLAVPKDPGTIGQDTLVVVRDIVEGKLLQNFKAFFDILNIKSINRKWLKDLEHGKGYDSEYAPKAWVNWIDTGRTTVELVKHKTKDYIENNTSHIYLTEGIDVYLNLPLEQVSKRLGVDNKIPAITRELTERFSSNSSFRSVRINLRGTVQESIPLDNINFETIIEERFEHSSLYNRFNQGFNFLVYDKESPGMDTLILKYAFLWKPDAVFIQNNIYPFWSNLKSIINEGVVIQQVKRGTQYVNKNNLPKIKDNPILHVRPKAKDAADTTPLHNGGSITKQAYWINSTYIRKLINDLEQDVLSKKHIAYESGNEKNYNKENIHSTKYSPEDYKERLGKSSVLGIIYTKDDYKEAMRNNIASGTVNSILENDYEVKYGYYINKAFDSVSEAIQYDILRLDYLDVNNYKYKNYSSFYNVFIHLRRELKIIEVEKDLFIIEGKLNKGGVSEKEIRKYIESVIEFAKNEKEYFNINMLKNNHVAPEMFSLGFQNIFYEEILKYNNRFRYQIYKGNVMFTINKVESTIFADLTKKRILAARELYRYEVEEFLTEEFEMKNINQTDILDFYDSDQGIYYCSHMDMFFENEARYLNIILRPARNSQVI